MTPQLKRFRRALALVFLLVPGSLSAPTPVLAQGTRGPGFAELLVERLDKLAADSAVRARTGAASGIALFGAMPPDAIGRVSDADLVRLLSLVEQGLGAADAATCATAYGRGGTDGLPQAFVAIASRLDSAKAVPWVDAFMPVFEAGLAGRPLGTRVALDEAVQLMRTSFAALSPEDQARLQRGAARSGTPEDMCFFVRKTYTSLLSAPVGKAAPALRTLMFGPGSPP
jgi:hypothetical protein